MGSGGVKEGLFMSSNFAPTDDDVLTIIRSLGRQNVNLRLTKSFRGMVLNQDINILEVNPDCATFQTTSIEMCAALEGNIYLHNQLFPRPVVAHLRNLNTCKGIFVLSGFAYIDTEWKERQYERVRPPKTVYVTLHWRRKAFRASLENISVNGMGLLAYKIFKCGMKIQPGLNTQLEFQLSPEYKYDPPFKSHILVFGIKMEFQPGLNTQLEFQLSPEYKYMALKGRIIYSHAINSLFVKLGIQLYPKAREARSLKKYIAQRNDEII